MNATSNNTLNNGGIICLSRWGGFYVDPSKGEKISYVNSLRTDLMNLDTKRGKNHEEL